MAGKPLRLLPCPQLITVDPALTEAEARSLRLRLIETRTRAQMCIADIDKALAHRVERRSAAPADDQRPPPGTPIEYTRGTGRILSVK